MSIFSSVLGLASRILTGFVFLLLEKNGLFVGMLFGGCLTGTGSTAVDAVCLALITFKVESFPVRG